MTRGVTVVLVWALLGFAACGSSQSDNEPQEPGPLPSMTGGASAAGGNRNGSGGSATVGQGGGASGGAAVGTAGASGAPGAGGAPGSAPLRDACRAYVAAYCEKQSECDGRGAEAAARCIATNDNCPDLLMSPGTGHSLENLLDCVEPMRTASCSDWRRNIQPACVTPGLRGKGEPCVYPSQCQSVSCNNEDVGAPCGFCRGLAAPGGACNLYDMECPAGQRCEEDVCVEIPASSDPLPVAPVDRAAEGEACAQSICETGLYCLLAGGAEGVCRALPSPGAACAELSTGPRCVATAYCSATGCAALPGSGQPCATDPFAPQCAKDLQCVSGVCTPLASVGEKCSPNPLKLVQSICKTDLVCACADAECRMGTCRTLAKEGAACGPTSACEHGTTCEGGVCRPSDALTGQAICDLRD